MTQHNQARPTSLVIPIPGKSKVESHKLIMTGQEAHHVECGGDA